MTHTPHAREIIERGAKALSANAQYKWNGIAEELRDDFRMEAKLVLIACGFGPVLDATHAVLPVEATEEMTQAADDARDGYDHDYIGSGRAWELMVRAHLNLEKAG